MSEKERERLNYKYFILNIRQKISFIRQDSIRYRYCHSNSKTNDDDDQECPVAATIARVHNKCKCLALFLSICLVDHIVSLLLSVIQGQSVSILFEYLQKGLWSPCNGLIILSCCWVLLRWPNPYVSSSFKSPITTKNGGKFRVTLIHGDGIGPEMMQHVKDAYRYVRAPVDFEDVILNSTNSTDQQSIEHSVLAGEHSLLLLLTWTDVSNFVVFKVKRNGVALKANIETDFNNMGIFSANVQIR